MDGRVFFPGLIKKVGPFIIEIGTPPRGSSCPARTWCPVEDGLWIADFMDQRFSVLPNFSSKAAARILAIPAASLK